MPDIQKYSSDIEIILSHRYDLGADFWTTPDKRLIKGSPFSTLECVMYLLELGVPSTDPILLKCADLIFDSWQPDGRFKLYPTGSIYPCQTINALAVLCHLGYFSDKRVQKTLQHLLEIQSTDGGWRCNKFSFGRGSETEFSNPFPTLAALDAFSFTGNDGIIENASDRAVEFLLGHWDIKSPIGPCHYGIGTLFMQVEYPFRSYNLFNYVYILSFYKKAVKDRRFIEAFDILKSKLQDGQIVVERNVPKLSKLSFCRKNEKSELATRRYNEILENLN